MPAWPFLIFVGNFCVSLAIGLPSRKRNHPFKTPFATTNPVRTKGAAESEFSLLLHNTGKNRPESESLREAQPEGRGRRTGNAHAPLSAATALVRVGLNLMAVGLSAPGGKLWMSSGQNGPGGVHFLSAAFYADLAFRRVTRRFTKG